MPPFTEFEGSFMIQFV